jgi:hypothetical protein
MSEMLRLLGPVLWALSAGPVVWSADRLLGVQPGGKKGLADGQSNRLV